MQILKELEWFRKKAPMTDRKLGEEAPRASFVQAAEELSEQDSEHFPQPWQKEMKTMISHSIHDESDECDPDDQLEEMMGPNESKGKNVDGDIGSVNLPVHHQ